MITGVGGAHLSGSDLQCKQTEVNVNSLSQSNCVVDGATLSQPITRRHRNSMALAVQRVQQPQSNALLLLTCATLSQPPRSAMTSRLGGRCAEPHGCDIRNVRME